MPHSSGGGSSGGGFHGGSSGGFSSGSGGNKSIWHNYSRTHFPGAYCYVYYAAGRPQIMYTTDKPTNSSKSYWISLFVKILFLLIPLAFIFSTCFHFPKKLKTNYDTEIIINDTIDVLSDEEESKLNQTFMSFFDQTGITPAFMSINDYTYSLENYAYNQYVKNFNDEKHWLIVYYLGERNNWQFEGMQGDNTDTILSNRVTSKFNKTFYNSLSKNNGVGDSLVGSFNTITPHLMDNYFYMEKGTIIFCVVWAGLLIPLVVIDSINMVKRRKLVGATLVDDESKLVLKKCPYCDTPYYANTVKICPRCNAPLSEDDPNVSSEKEGI